MSIYSPVQQLAIIIGSVKMVVNRYKRKRPKYFQITLILAIMIELNRSLYMHAETGIKATGFEKLKTVWEIIWPNRRANSGFKIVTSPKPQLKFKIVQRSLRTCSTTKTSKTLLLFSQLILEIAIFLDLSRLPSLLHPPLTKMHPPFLK